MHKTDTIQPQFSMRFADGTRMWLNTDSPVDILLHPVFLKYLAICVLLGTLLDRGGAGTGTLDAAQAAALWIVIGFEALMWLWLAFFFLRKMALRRKISGIYSPVILVPFFLLTQLTTYHFANAVFDVPVDFNVFMSDLFRDIIMLFVFDVIFSSYVVHQHPAFSKTPVDLAQLKPDTAPINEWQVPGGAGLRSDRPADAPAPATKEQSQTTRFDKALIALETSSSRANEVQIGGSVFGADEILMLRSEDHYLTVVTPNRKVLVRARLTDTVAKLDLRYGVQINRSVWVAFAAIDRLRKTQSGLQVYMRDGSEETVATVRRHAVRSAFEMYQMRG